MGTRIVPGSGPWRLERQNHVTHPKHNLGRSGRLVTVTVFVWHYRLLRGKDRFESVRRGVRFNVNGLLDG